MLNDSFLITCKGNYIGENKMIDKENKIKLAEIMDTANMLLQKSLENDSQQTKDYFKKIQDNWNTKSFLYEEEKGLSKYINIKVGEESRIRKMDKLLREIANGEEIVDVGEVISKVITTKNCFHKRLYKTEDRLLINIVDENVKLYFYPFIDGDAYYGYVSELDNGFLYFTGLVIQHEFYYELIDVMLQEVRVR